MTDDATGEDRRESSPSTRDDAVEYVIEADEPPSEAVVRAVASFTNTPVLDIEPLYHVIDPAHLDGLFGCPSGRSPSLESSITIAFNGCRVTVTPNVVRVRERDGEDG